MAANATSKAPALPPSTRDDLETPSGRKLLSIEPLGLQDLPPHREFPESKRQRATLVSFLSRLLTEANGLDFDHGWTSRGIWQPEGSRVKIPMPASSRNPNASPVDVAVNVEQRTKGEGRKVWLARRSYHHAIEVDYAELEQVLAKDHARQEAEYTPSVYDANEILAWNAEELSEAVAQLEPSWRVQSVQMNIYQMFHTMPSALGGLVKLQDRFFHVLVVTAHSKYSVGQDDTSGSQSQALTFQLPIDIRSLSAVSSVSTRSHTDTTFKRYQFQDASTSHKSPDSFQKGRSGSSLIEGFYVSLERLRQAPHEASSDIKDTSGMHQWDMMTMSNARGITKIASQSQIMKGTLDAVTKDVYYVLDHIRHQRQSVHDRGEIEEAGLQGKKKVSGHKESEDIKLTRVRS